MGLKEDLHNAIESGKNSEKGITQGQNDQGQTQSYNFGDGIIGKFSLNDGRPVNESGNDNNSNGEVLNESQN